MATEIELLAAVQAKPYEACEQEWKRLLQELRLGLLYVPAIQAVIEQGRWKEHANPMAYVRKGAVQCAVRMGIVDIRPNQNMEILACDLQYRDEEVPTSASRLQETRVDALALALYQVKHLFDQPRRRKHFPVVCNAPLGFDQIHR